MALRTEWERDGTSNRALGRRYGLSEMAIRKRAARADQPGGPWVKQSAVPEGRRPPILRLVKGREAGADRCEPRGGPQFAANQGADPANPAEKAGSSQSAGAGVRGLGLTRVRARETPARTSSVHETIGSAALKREVYAEPETRAALREEVIEQTAAAMAQHNLEVLDRLKQTKLVADRLACLILGALSGPEDGLEQRAARELLAACPKDSLCKLMQTLIRMQESIQNQTRKALGMDAPPGSVRPAVPVQPTRAAPNLHGPSELDISELSVEQLAALVALAELVEASRGERPLPMPPRNPARADVLTSQDAPEEPDP